MAAMVCGQDPRTVAQRRSDALRRVGCRAPAFVMCLRAGGGTAVVDDGRATRSPSTCWPTPRRCPHRSTRRFTGKPPPSRSMSPRPSANTTKGTAARRLCSVRGHRGGCHHPEPVESTAGSRRTRTPEAAGTGRPYPRRPGHPGFEQLADLTLAAPPSTTWRSPAAESQKGHRPTPSLATWIRHRDLTCAAPGCDRPATSADLDHSTPALRPHPSVQHQGIPSQVSPGQTFWPGFTDRQKT